MPGVELCSLVGKHNGARNLFTGLLTLAPQAAYPLYARPFTETLIVIDGNAAVEVEDRRYSLERLDAISISARRPRRVVNQSTDKSALIHISLANSTPDQIWVNGRFSAVDQPSSATGRREAESVSRNDRITPFELAPRALFQDLFDADTGRDRNLWGPWRFRAGSALALPPS